MARPTRYRVEDRVRVECNEHPDLYFVFVVLSIVDSGNGIYIVACKELAPEQVKVFWINDVGGACCEDPPDGYVRWSMIERMKKRATPLVRVLPEIAVH